MDEQFEIEVFRPGTFTPMSGAALTFSAEDLAAVAAVYDAEGAPAPAVVGHPTTDAPAYGWASGFRYDGERGRLLAVVGDLEPAFAEAVRAKRYRKVSISFHQPSAAANPKPGSWDPKHIGFLGAAAPAVPGLKPVAFSGTPEESVTIEFGEPAFRDAASLFRRLRDWLIETKGVEKADEILPGFEIEWLARQADEPAPGFSAPPPAPAPVEDPALKPTPTAAEAAFAARETAVATRERQLAEREAVARHADHEAFCEALVKEGRLLPASKPETVGLLDALAAGDAPVEVAFSDASGRAVKEPVTDTVKRLLKAMPVQVDFSALDRGPRAGAGSAVAFAAPEGRAVDAAGLELHAKALDYQRRHPDTDYLAAVRAVS